jgi:hypothetical protein
MPEHLLFRWIVLRIVIWHHFGDLNQSENLSEIKPPLIIHNFNCYGIWKLHSTNLASNNSLFLCVLWVDIENNVAIAKLDDTEQPL